MIHDGELDQQHKFLICKNKDDSDGDLNQWQNICDLQKSMKKIFVKIGMVQDSDPDQWQKFENSKNEWLICNWK